MLDSDRSVLKQEPNVRGLTPMMLDKQKFFSSQLHLIFDFI